MQEHNGTYGMCVLIYISSFSKHTAKLLESFAKLIFGLPDPHFRFPTQIFALCAILQKVILLSCSSKGLFKIQTVNKLKFREF